MPEQESLISGMMPYLGLPHGVKAKAVAELQKLGLELDTGRLLFVDFYD